MWERAGRFVKINDERAQWIDPRAVVSVRDGLDSLPGVVLTIRDHGDVFLYRVSVSQAFEMLGLGNG